jgi:GAF domain-containing protein
VIGVISAQSYEKEYDQNHLEFLSAVASQASIAIQNAVMQVMNL